MLHNICEASVTAKGTPKFDYFFEKRFFPESVLTLLSTSKQNHTKLLSTLSEKYFHLKSTIILIIIKTFWCFTNFPFHHKWNEARLLLINMVRKYCLTSCWNTYNVGASDLKKNQKNLKTCYSYKPAPSPHPWHPANDRRQNTPSPIGCPAPMQNSRSAYPKTAPQIPWSTPHKSHTPRRPTAKYSPGILPRLQPEEIIQRSAYRLLTNSSLSINP